MKKGHWITIVVLSLLTFGFMLFAFVRDISAKRTLEFAQEYYERNHDLEKIIEDQEFKIDSLISVIDSLKK